MIDTQACNITYKNVLPLQIKCQPLQSVWPKELHSFLSPLRSWVQVGLDKKGTGFGFGLGDEGAKRGGNRGGRQKANASSRGAARGLLTCSRQLQN